MNALRYVRWSLAVILLVDLSSCRKEVSTDLPPLGGFRTYDWVPVKVKPDPWGGFVLLCKRSPSSSWTSYLQLLGPTGEPGGRVDLDQLPDTFGNALAGDTVIYEFESDKILYTDLVAHASGDFTVVGLAHNTTGLSGGVYLIGRKFHRSGGLKSTFLKWINSGAVVTVNDDADLYTDLYGLPREKALCEELPDGTLVVSVRYEDATRSFVRTVRFPSALTGQPPTEGGFPMGRASRRLHQMACDPLAGQPLLIYDSTLSGLQTGAAQDVSSVDQFTGWDWNECSKLGADPIEPQQLQWNDGQFTLVGYVTNVNDGRFKPFAAQFTRTTGSPINLHILSGLGSPEQSVACYCAGVWGGRVELLVNIQEASALSPYFLNDVSSDLVLAELDPDLGLVSTRLIVPRQGLRPIGLFHVNGQHIVIGSHHPYLNPNLQHTFFLALDR